MLQVVCLGAVAEGPGLGERALVEVIADGPCLAQAGLVVDPPPDRCRHDRMQNLAASHRHALMPAGAIEIARVERGTPGGLRLDACFCLTENC